MLLHWCWWKLLRDPWGLTSAGLTGWCTHKLFTGNAFQLGKAEAACRKPRGKISLGRAWTSRNLVLEPGPKKKNDWTALCSSERFQREVAALVFAALAFFCFGLHPYGRPPSSSTGNDDAMKNFRPKI